MQRPSMARVATLAGVSKNTVSLALRGSTRIAAATREKVEAAAASMSSQKSLQK